MEINNWHIWIEVRQNYLRLGCCPSIASLSIRKNMKSVVDGEKEVPNLSSDSPPKSHHRRETVYNVRIHISSSSYIDPHTRCMTEFDGPTRIMRLHLEHSNSIVQLLGNLSSLSLKSFRWSSWGNILVWSWFAATRVKEFRIEECAASKRLCSTYESERTIIDANCIGVVCTNKGDISKTTVAKFSMPVACGCAWYQDCRRQRRSERRRVCVGR